MKEKRTVVYYPLQSNFNKTISLSAKTYFMKNIIRISLFAFTMSLLISGFSSCQRQASCPAYNSVDPSKSNVSMSKEKFMNSELKAKTPEENKKEVEKKKKEQLNTTHNRKKSSNLFPSYMR
jgi:hypothetical protein